MSRYMLLLYAADGDEAERERRWAMLPEWNAVADSLRETAMLVSNAALKSVDAATTVRVRDGDIDLTDGPFATTKEVLAGYFLLDCADLDQAIKQAARLPIARYGSVEIRPVVELTPPPLSDDAVAR